MRPAESGGYHYRGTRWYNLWREEHRDGGTEEPRPFVNVLDLSLGTARQQGQSLSLKGSQVSQPQKDAPGGGGVEAQR